MAIVKTISTVGKIKAALLFFALSVQIVIGCTPEKGKRIEVEQGGSAKQSQGGAGSSNLGGGDPSGGEGTRVTRAQVRSAVQSGFEELPNLMARMPEWFETKKGAEETLFLRECFVDSDSECSGNVFATIELIKTRFEQNQMFVEGECESDNHLDVNSPDEEPEPADMSLDEELQLCVSYNLQRYSSSGIRHEVIALLAHELLHGLGFGETRADQFQNWILANKEMTFIPMESIDRILGKLEDFEIKGYIAMSFVPRLATNVQRVQSFCGSLESLLQSWSEIEKNLMSTDQLGIPEHLQTFGETGPLFEILNTTCAEEFGPSLSHSEIFTRISSFVEDSNLYRQRILDYLLGVRDDTGFGTSLDDIKLLVPEIVQQQLDQEVIEAHLNCHASANGEESQEIEFEDIKFSPISSISARNIYASEYSSSFNEYVNGPDSNDTMRLMNDIYEGDEIVLRQIRVGHGSPIGLLVSSAPKSNLSVTRLEWIGQNQSIENEGVLAGLITNSNEPVRILIEYSNDSHEENSISISCQLQNTTEIHN